MKMKKISRRRFLKLTGCAGALGLVASYPVFIERYIILTNTYRIPVPNLPEVFSGFRIVQLTDLHHGALVPLHLIRSVLARANLIKRDVVVCTGDYVHERNSIGEIDYNIPVLRAGFSTYTLTMFILPILYGSWRIAI